MPLILMGIVSLLAAILAIFLPETAGIKLPDTVEEAEVLFKRKNFLKKSSDKTPHVKLEMRSSNNESDGHDNQGYLWRTRYTLNTIIGKRTLPDCKSILSNLLTHAFYTYINQFSDTVQCLTIAIAFELIYL